MFKSVGEILGDCIAQKAHWQVRAEKAEAELLQARQDNTALADITDDDLREMIRNTSSPRIRDLAAALLLSYQDNANCIAWHDSLLAGDGRSVEMAFANFRNWTPERRHQLGMMLLPDYLTLAERLKAARDDAARGWRFASHEGYCLNRTESDCICGHDMAQARHEAIVAQEAK
jgi:hypothetical protein